MYPDEYPKTGLDPAQPARPATEEELAKDTRGRTNPNLHRRIDPEQPDPGSGEISPRQYTLQIHGAVSYRTTRKVLHDEESTTSEVP